MSVSSAAVLVCRSCLLPAAAGFGETYAVPHLQAASKTEQPFSGLVVADGGGMAINPTAILSFGRREPRPAWIVTGPARKAGWPRMFKTML